VDREARKLLQDTITSLRAADPAQYEWEPQRRLRIGTALTDMGLHETAVQLFGADQNPRPR
jgi:hypothetical protein